MLAYKMVTYLSKTDKFPDSENNDVRFMRDQYTWKESTNQRFSYKYMYMSVVADSDILLKLYVGVRSEPGSLKFSFDKDENEVAAIK